MSAVRHSFENRDPVDRFSEQVVFYGKLRGTTYHRVLPLPTTLLSDIRQLIKPWNQAAIDAISAFASGFATEWKGVYKQWVAAVDRVEASTQSPNEVYSDNAGFWLALRKLAIQLGAQDMIVRRGDVLVWAVKETLREHTETVKEHAEAVYDAGKAAADAVTGAASAIPTIAKALAVAAVGVGIYAIAKR